MARYTVSEMAKLSGVSVRALHHYDDLGLLKPASLGANGYRYYGRKELLRLQQILFHRELGLTLERIKALLDDPAFDRVAALTAQRGELEREAARFRGLIATIDRTIAQLKGDGTMPDEDLYRGFSPQKQAQWEAEIEARYGEHGRTKVAESKASFAKMTKADVEAGKTEMDAVNRALAEAMDAGEATDGGRVQALAARHHAWVSRAWKPNRAAYIGLGTMYVENPDFRAVYEAVRPGLTAFLAEAMRVFADTALED